MTKTTIRNDDPSSQPTALVLVVFVAVFIVTVLGLQAYFNRVSGEEFEAKVIKRDVTALQDLHREQEAQLERLGWVDRSAGVVEIPIERAMDLVAAELARDSRNSGGR